MVGTEMAGLFIIASHTKYFTLMLFVLFFLNELLFCVYFFTIKNQLFLTKKLIQKVIVP